MYNETYIIFKMGKMTLAWESFYNRCRSKIIINPIFDQNYFKNSGNLF